MRSEISSNSPHPVLHGNLYVQGVKIIRSIDEGKPRPPSPAPWFFAYLTEYPTDGRAHQPQLPAFTHVRKIPATKPRCDRPVFGGRGCHRAARKRQEYHRGPPPLQRRGEDASATPHPEIIRGRLVPKFWDRFHNPLQVAETPFCSTRQRRIANRYTASQ